MKIGDLVRRIHRTPGQQQRALKFGDSTKDIGVVVEINSVTRQCLILFSQSPKPVVYPISGEYLEILNETR